MYFLLWEKSEEKSIITQTYFTQTLKRDSIIYYFRHYAQQKVFFLLFFFFENFPEKQCGIAGHIEIERSYVKQIF